jgi:competence ComEA-like helix-hairpin-helix protein
MEDFRLRDLFFFSKRERRGIFVLLAILFIVLLIRLNVYNLVPSDNETVDSTFINEVNAFLERREIEKKPEKIVASRRIPEERSQRNHRLFEFDPNTISNKEWKELGISDRQLEVINNYRASGGMFYKKADLKKIYGIDEDLYNRLKSYIKIEKETGKREPDSAFEKKEKKELPVIEINTADTFQLALLNGIGPVYARRIVKYRDLLGGFYTKEQLAEVYGIKEELLEHIGMTIKVNGEKVSQIDLNKAKFSELIRHPYLNEYQTKAILQYRKFKGKIKSRKELLSNNILDKKTYSRMKPYLAVK